MRKSRLNAVVVAALGLTGLLAGQAVAAPGDEALIPPGSTGSITVHKFTQPPSYGDDNLGMELPASQIAGLTPLAGSTFRVQRVTEVDLSTNAGWQKARDAEAAFDPFDPVGSLTAAGFGLASGRSETTGSTGLAQFAGLPVGLYLVDETSTPVVEANQTVTAAMPFLITVPLTDPSDLRQWVYNVHAYPKNVVSTATKSVVDAPAIGLGDTVDWPITVSIPGGSVTSKYVVTDVLDPKLEYVSTKVTIDGRATSDFAVTHDGDKVVTSLGASARMAAFQALQSNPAAKVVVTHSTVVVKAGEIANDASLTFHRDGEPETEVVSNVVETRFGGINVFKHNDAAPTRSTALQGAVFQVRAANTKDFAAASVVTVDGVDAWTTDSSGMVAIDGLRYSGWADGGPVSQDSGKYNFYWLVETKAPAGYELLAEPIPFTVDAQVAVALTIDVVNTPSNVGAPLPKTGAAGTAVLMMAGAALLAGGTFVTVRAARRPGEEV